MIRKLQQAKNSGATFGAVTEGESSRLKKLRPTSKSTLQQTTRPDAAKFKLAGTKLKRLYQIGGPH